MRAHKHIQHGAEKQRKTNNEDNPENDNDLKNEVDRQQARGSVP